MPLKAKRRPIGARQSLEGAVEERHMGRSQVTSNTRWVDGKTVVLAGDHHAPGVEVLYRMVRAVVAELHLERPRARGEPHELVAEANAEHRDAGRVQDLADRLDGVVARLRVAGPVGEE